MTNPDAPPSNSPSGFEVRLPRWTRWLWVAVIFVLAWFVAWWMTHPQALPSSSGTLDASTKAGHTVYVGVTNDADFAKARELHIRDVTFKKVTNGSRVMIEALICHDGSINTTANPAPFCASVKKAIGATVKLGGGDQLVIGVTPLSSQIVELHDIKVSYREGLQWGTQPAGPNVVVDVVG
jgi:hypothetical protein